MSFFSFFQPPLGSENNPGISAQAILDDNPNNTSGNYFIDIPNVGVKKVYCEFIDGYGFIVAANTDMSVRDNIIWTWNDVASWRQSGSNYGDVNNPYNPSSPQYRDKDVWNNYKGTKVGIMIHDDGAMFRDGSYVFFNLTSNQSNKSWSELMQNNGAAAGGDQITETYFAQKGVDTAGSTRNTSGHYSPELDYCTIARSMPGHLKVNHLAGNNAIRILGSNQILETSNDDATRGIGAHFSVSLDPDATSNNWNSHGAPTETDNPFLDSNHRMYPPFDVYPDGSNSSAVGDSGNFATIPPQFNYAILIN